MSGPADFSTAGWTPDRVALLRRHFAVGLTAAESGILLGVSKNAIISKRTRLGLVGTVRQGRQADEPQRRPSREPLLKFLSEPEFRRSPLPVMDRPPPADAAPKSLALRGRGECAWPLGPAEEPGDWRTLFCCAPSQPGRRYCPVHMVRARR